MSTAGGALAIVGLFSSAIAASSKPAADTRRWAGLPGAVFAFASSADPEAPLDVRFQPSRGAAGKINTALDRSAGGCRLVYGVRGASGSSTDPASARRAISDGEFTKTMRRNAGRDGAFRKQLLASLTHDDWVAPAVEQDNGSEPVIARAAPADSGERREVAVRERSANAAGSEPAVDAGGAGEAPAQAEVRSERTAAPVHLETATGAFPRLDLDALWRDVDLSDPSEREE